MIALIFQFTLIDSFPNTPKPIFQFTLIDSFIITNKVRFGNNSPFILDSNSVECSINDIMIYNNNNKLYNLIPLKKWLYGGHDFFNRACLICTVP